MILSDPFPSLLALRQRIVPPSEPVLPVPPHDPEPHPDEPFTPRYDYVPLRASDGELGRIRPPRHPDEWVFGPEDAMRLQSGGNASRFDRWRSCPCGVTWRGGGGCWACGEAS